MKEGRIMIKVDIEKCTSCRACLLACSGVKFDVFNPKKALLRMEEGIPFAKVHVCIECGKCKEVCPVEAISEENGIYKIDKDKCIGCQTCVMNCPEKVIIMVDGKAWKCDECGECVKHCTIGALSLKSGKGASME